MALNARKEIVHKVAVTGLNGLTPYDRAQLPEEIDVNNEHYRQLYESYDDGNGTCQR